MRMVVSGKDVKEFDYKRLKRAFEVFLCVITLSLVFSARAGAEPVSEEEYKALESRVEQLEAALRKAGIELPPASTVELAMPSSGAPEKKAEVYHTPEERRQAVKKTRVGKSFEFDGLLETNAYLNHYESTEGRGETDNDVILKTAQLGWRASIGEVASGTFVLLWEEDGPDAIQVDEGTLTWHGDRFDVTAGRVYPPFGTFDTHFVLDPITQELGEVRKSAVKLHYAPNHVLDTSLTFADREVERAEMKDDRLGDICLRLDVTPKLSGGKTLALGYQYFSNLADTNADLLGVSGAASAHVLNKVVAGRGIYLSMSKGPWSLSGEYIGAAGRFDPANLDADANGIGDRPGAWNFETAFAKSPRNEIALKYEGSAEFSGFPKSQYGLDSSWNVGEGMTFSIGYLTGKFSEVFALLNGAGKVSRRDVMVSQFSLEF